MNVVLSHIAEDLKVASVLGQWIESSLDRDIRFSSDAEGFRPDEQRRVGIDGALAEARVVLVLCSARSIGLPWISFEAGCAWHKGVPVMSVCHDGCSADDLPAPLGSFRAFDLTDATSCQALLETLANHLERRRVPRIDCGQMVAELKAAPTSSELPEPTAMRAGVAAAPVRSRRDSREKPKPIEIRLLDTIKRLPEYTCTATGLAAGLGESERQVSRTLDKLVSNQLLTKKASTHPTDPETRYAMTDRGRDYLAKHDR